MVRLCAVSVPLLLASGMAAARASGLIDLKGRFRCPVGTFASILNAQSGQFFYCASFKVLSCKDGTVGVLNGNTGIRCEQISFSMPQLVCPAGSVAPSVAGLLEAYQCKTSRQYTVDCPTLNGMQRTEMHGNIGWDPTLQVGPNVGYRCNYRLPIGASCPAGAVPDLQSRMCKTSDGAFVSAIQTTLPN